MTDLRSSSGTYVNGMRSAERWLEDRDQIGVGKTILMLRSGVADSAETVEVRPAAETNRYSWLPAPLCFCFAPWPQFQSRADAGLQ